MVEKGHSQLSVRQQCILLDVNRNRLEAPPDKTTPEDLRIMRLLDELHLKEPCYGARRMSQILGRDHALPADRKRVARLMRLMGIEAWLAQAKDQRAGAWTSGVSLPAAGSGD